MEFDQAACEAPLSGHRRPKATRGYRCISIEERAFAQSSTTNVPHCSSLSIDVQARGSFDGVIGCQRNYTDLPTAGAQVLGAPLKRSHSAERGRRRHEHQSQAAIDTEDGLPRGHVGGEPSACVPNHLRTTDSPWVLVESRRILHEPVSQPTLQPIFQHEDRRLVTRLVKKRNYPRAAMPAQSSAKPAKVV